MLSDGELLEDPRRVIEIEPRKEPAATEHPSAMVQAMIETGRIDARPHVANLPREAA